MAATVALISRSSSLASEKSAELLLRVSRSKSRFLVVVAVVVGVLLSDDVRMFLGGRGGREREALFDDH